jgi:hypothetical protein
MLCVPKIINERGQNSGVQSLFQGLPLKNAVLKTTQHDTGMYRTHRCMQYQCHCTLIIFLQQQSIGKI